MMAVLLPTALVRGLCQGHFHHNLYVYDNMSVVVCMCMSVVDVHTCTLLHTYVWSPIKKSFVIIIYTKNTHHGNLGRKENAQQTSQLHRTAVFSREKKKRCPGWDSNPRHSALQASALPTELHTRATQLVGGGRDRDNYCRLH